MKNIDQSAQSLGLAVQEMIYAANIAQADKNHLAAAVLNLVRATNALVTVTDDCVTINRPSNEQVEAFRAARENAIFMWEVVVGKVDRLTGDPVDGYTRSI